MPSKRKTNANKTEQNMNYAFQPIYDTRTDILTVYGREALMRPSGTTPGEYIEQMIGENRSHELEYSTFVNSVRQFAERGYSEKLFINSLPYEFLNEDEIEEFDNLCDSLGISEIVVENLEYGNQFDFQKMSKKIQTLRKHGYKIALDDFGSGINSVDALELIKPDIVKIDRYFVSGCLRNDICKNTVEIIVNSLRPYGVGILAEGVETKEEFDFLKKLHVDFMQGYYLGYPE